VGKILFGRPSSPKLGGWRRRRWSFALRRLPLAVLIDLVLQVGHLPVNLVQNDRGLLGRAGDGFRFDRIWHFAGEEVEQLIQIDLFGRVVGRASAFRELRVELSSQLRELLHFAFHGRLVHIGQAGEALLPLHPFSHLFYRFTFLVELRVRLIFLFLFALALFLPPPAFLFQSLSSSTLFLDPFGFSQRRRHFTGEHAT
jgi:hypothetical protein